MTQHSTSFTFEARYYKLGEITEATRQVWFVLHGYGQLAEYFLKKFSALDTQRICVIAPEGLSRFYLEDVTKRSQGGSQRVGATWMTRENRLMDIENYLTYLNSVYQVELGNRTGLDITIFGFSQGAATASRWAIHNTITFNRLILWAGIFPDDMDFERAHDVLSSKKIELVYGTADPFLNDQRLVQLRTLTERMNIEASVHTFAGAHELDADTLRLLAH
jgi:predicted esterase